MKKYIPHAIAVIFILLFLHQCQKARHFKEQTQNVSEFLNDSIRTYKNKYGQVVAEKTALEGDKASLSVLLSKQVDSTRQLSKLVKKHRRTIAAGNITTVTKIDTIRIGYEVPVPFEFERSFLKENPFYSLEGVSNQNGITVNSLEVPNTMSFVVGNRRGNTTVSVVNSNPYIITTGADTYVLKQSAKRFGFSVFVGYGVGINGLTPIIGVGLGYQLFRF